MNLEIEVKDSRPQQEWTEFIRANDQASFLFLSSALSIIIIIVVVAVAFSPFVLPAPVSRRRPKYQTIQPTMSASAVWDWTGSQFQGRYKFCEWGTRIQYNICNPPHFPITFVRVDLEF